MNDDERKKFWEIVGLLVILTVFAVLIVWGSLAAKNMHCMGGGKGKGASPVVCKEE